MMTIFRKIDLFMQSLMFKQIVQKIVAKTDIFFINIVIICQIMNIFIN